MKAMIIAGNIGRDAVTRTTQNGDKITNWSVGVEDRKGREKSTLWFKCDWWGSRGEKLAQYLTKGSKVTVSGDFSTEEYEGKTQLLLRVDNVTLQGGRSDGQQGGTSRSDNRDQGRQDDPYDSEIPF